MIISRCTKSDLSAIQHLMSKYGGKMIVTEYHINNRDVALQARLETGELIGFVWAALMASNTVAYVDKVAVDPEHAGKGVINALYKELLRIGLKRGVRQVTGIIRHDQYHTKSCKAVLRMGIGADPLSYTYVSADLNFMKSEIGLEV